MPYQTAPIVFNNTVLRDGHQSLAATRMRTEQMLPALAGLDSIGFGALETWGGATVDAALRFLGEFPFERLDTLKLGAPKTPHMMLLRGQNLLGYAHFPDDIVEAFIGTVARHGMDIFRIFDALNDTRNLHTAIAAVKAMGKHAQGTICYTASPVHTAERFVQLGLELVEQGCDSLCLKDMAGLIPPVITATIIRGLKAKVDVPIVLHTHDTAGLGATTYFAGIEANVDAIDTSIAPFANGTGQPDTLRMLSMLEHHPRQPHYDRHKLAELRKHFEDVYAELADFTSPKNEQVDSDALTYQVPGGMLSNFRTQVKQQGMETRFTEIMAEIPYVRQALGWIPLVTPTSQIVGFQALLNVKFGRWQTFSPQAADIALGYYGRTPASVDPEVRGIAERKSGKPPIDCRPADLQAPRLDSLRAELEAKGLPNDDEHCVIYAMFPEQLLGLYPRAVDQPARTAAAIPGAQTAAPVMEPAATAAGNPGRKRSRFTLWVDSHRHQIQVEEA
ncbi:MAG: pyruvate carboxylase subunit B [Gammaproteobacteria bacterium]